MNCDKRVNNAILGIVLLISWIILVMTKDIINSEYFGMFLALYICTTFFITLRCIGEYIDCIVNHEGCEKLNISKYWT